MDSHLDWHDFENREFSDEETKVACFLSVMGRATSNRAKLVKQFEEYYFGSKPKLSSKLIKILLNVSVKHAKINCNIINLG